MNFVGFDLTAAELAADEWWFVLEQQLTAPRFGFDIEDLPAGDHVDVAALRGRRAPPTVSPQRCCSSRSASPCTVTASSFRWPGHEPLRAAGHRDERRVVRPLIAHRTRRAPVAMSDVRR